MVLFYHDTVWQKTDREKMNRAIFAALKPGGFFAVIDHSGRPGTGTGEAQTFHRIEEKVCARRSGARRVQARGRGRLPQEPRRHPRLERLPARSGRSAGDERSVRAEVREAGGVRARGVPRPRPVRNAEAPPAPPGSERQHSPARQHRAPSEGLAPGTWHPQPDLPGLVAGCPPAPPEPPAPASSTGPASPPPPSSFGKPASGTVEPPRRDLDDYAVRRLSKGSIDPLVLETARTAKKYFFPEASERFGTAAEVPLTLTQSGWVT